MKKEYEIILNNVEETLRFAERLAGKCREGDVIALEGDLGAGKTTFTKGFARGLGIKRTVNSPTFTIIKEYEGRLPLYHMDVYRVADEMEDLGFEEYFEGEGVTVIEWAHLIEEQLPRERLTIYLYNQGLNERKMVVVASGERYEQLCEGIFS